MDAGDAWPVRVVHGADLDQVVPDRVRCHGSHGPSMESFLAAAAERRAPLRIVSLSQAHTLMLASLEASHLLVALDTFGSQPSGVADLPRIDSFSPDASVVRQLHPDIIIASFESQARAFDALDGVRVLLLKAPQGPSAAEQMLSQLTLLAELVGRETRAEALVSAGRAQLTALRALAAPLAGRRFLLELDPEGFTASDDAYLGQLLTDLGLLNAASALQESPATAAYFCPSVESICQSQIDFYLVMHQGAPRPLPALGVGAVRLQAAVHYDRVAWSLALLDVLEQCVRQMLEAAGHPCGPTTKAGIASGAGAASADDDTTALLEGVRFTLALDGVDLLVPLSTGWYNDAIARLAEREPAARKLRPLPDFDRSGNCLALLLANTHAIWRPFSLWLRGDAARVVQHQHPFDTYLQQVVNRALDALLPGFRRDVFWACEEGTPRMVAMQRAAECAGLAHLDPSTHLSIHPTFGAWLSLRAVVVLDLPGLGHVPPAPLASPLSDEEREEASRALQKAIVASSDDLCKELHGPGRGGGAGGSRMESCDRGAPAWREWVALRDVVRLGRRYRFCEDQIKYHYTKDRAILRDMLG